MSQSEKLWIFGLSIDEGVFWSAMTIDSKTGEYEAVASDWKKGKLCDIPVEAELDLEEWLSKHLFDLKKNIPEIFADCISIGVSCVGIIDTNNCVMQNFDRKRWTKHRSKKHSEPYIVDFQSLLRSLFTNKALKIAVHNDATAKCLAEFENQFRRKERDASALEPVDLVFYANFHDGVNGGFVRGRERRDGRRSSEPVATLMHQELGHISPRQHPKDKFNAAYSGCPVHERCFVGLAGGARIKKQWGKPLRELKLHQEQPWNIIAYYIAHFCYNAVLTIPPKRILLAGEVIFPELLPRIRTEFRELNEFEGSPYIDYPELRNDDFISLASLGIVAGGVMGGLELARRSVMKGEILSLADQNLWRLN